MGVLKVAEERTTENKERFRKELPLMSDAKAARLREYYISVGAITPARNEKDDPYEGTLDSDQHVKSYKARLIREGLLIPADSQRRAPVLPQPRGRILFVSQPMVRQ